MADNKIIEEDIVEEHNGVYGSKWHIVSTEGFDLPEGLKYLKNSWEGSVENRALHGVKRIQKYKASMRISNVRLDEALKKVTYLLGKFFVYDTDVEIINCPGGANKGFADQKFSRHIGNFILHGCVLKFEDLSHIMILACVGGSSKEYSLTKNIFVNKDWTFIDEIKGFFDRNPEYRDLLSFDLRDCNFSNEDKKLLKISFSNLSVLI